MNDPRTTAYALNELQGAEREKFESDLANDPLLQRDLLAACELTDALGEMAEEPGEGLEPQAKEKLLRAIAANQEAFRARRKIVRFAVPVSLAAAASIAVLLWVSGGTTAQEHPIAAASAPDGTDDKGAAGNFAAEVSSAGQSFVFTGAENGSATGKQSGFAVNPTRIVVLSENASALQGASNFSQPEVRRRSLLTSEEIPLWGSGTR